MVGIHRSTPPLQGLTAQEVRQRQLDGRSNAVKHTVTKPLSRIFIDNICTVFNLVNAIIAVALLLVESYHNMLFFGVALCNTAIGIIQELRSKRTLEKLSLLYAARATVIRDGNIQNIPIEDIVSDDTLLIESGDQICVDAVVSNGEIEVNESLLTGEPDPILKKAGDTLLSGSFAVSGRAAATAHRVGEECYAAKLTAQAKTYHRLRSQLMTSVDKIIRFTGLFMIPFGILLILRGIFSDGFDLAQTVTATAAALIGMMPQGLILLTTVSLMVGVVKLAKKRTLVQELYCIETLSRVSMLCLDKTGTLTKGTMTVSGVVPLDDRVPDLEKHAWIRAAVDAIGDTNATAVALREFYHAQPTADAVFSPLAVVPFSSQRKWSAAAFQGVGTIFLGAYDRLLDHAAMPQEIQALEKSGKRVLLAAISECEDIENARSSLRPLAAIVLEDELRDNAKEILAFFQEEDVTLRVISGDHPQTVAAVAAKAGLKNASLAVDVSALTTPEDLRAAAETYTVFGRVSPEQKRELIRLFKEQGHTVAMTGDGVNDVPALKEADCSVAMAAGSDAAKQVSQLVLLNSDFSSLPVAVMEGRRVVNNITRTASLFLVKTVMSFLVTMCAILLPMNYPFEPLQLTLIGMFAESIPGFFLTLEPSRERIKGDFLHTVLCSAVPGGVIIAVFAALVQMTATPLFSFSDEQASTLCVYLTGFVWLVQLMRICRPFTAARRILWITMTVGFFAAVLLLANVLPTLFASWGMTLEPVFVIPTPTMLCVFAALALISFPLDHALYKLARRLWPETESR